ncbi:transposase [Actinacidiphila glaucinigra]|uniref:transposase n=1 Tax=Actinacidiphila glaucinigra TaxID=235986 RepID=UPI003AF3821B
MSDDLVPDDLWERIAPLLPPQPARRHGNPGQLRVPDRIALAGIVYVLRKGVAWRDVPAGVVGCSGRLVRPPCLPWKASRAAG